jgi:hypothetical protein
VTSSGRVVELVFVAALAACSEADKPAVTGPPPTVAIVEVAPALATVSVGQTQTFTASVLDSGRRPVSGQTVSWSTNPSNAATVDTDGRVTALTAGSVSVRAAVGSTSGAAVLVVTQGQPSTGDISVDPSITYQTMQGWDVIPNVGHWECDTIYFDQALTERFRNTALDMAVEIGLDRVRLPLRAGAENPHDYWKDFENGQIDFATYKTVWYDGVNDNNDPLTMNPAGFHFSEIDYHIDKVVQPLRQRLQAKGERLYVVLNLIQFQRAQPWEHRNYPEEYAEFMLAAFQHIRDKYGFVPDAIEVINEPDNGNIKWTPQQVGNAIVATGNRLRAAGFQPGFIAPSTANMLQAVSYFDVMMGMSGVRQYLTELSYHRYGSATPEVLKMIGDRARQYKIGTAMLEHIGSGYDDLHQDLKVGLNTSWEQYTMAGCFPFTVDAGGRHLHVDITNRLNPRVTLATRSQFLRQYYKWVRQGAVRIEATSGRASLDPLAFVNRNGAYTVVVKAARAETFTIGGLPAGRYGIVYTTGPDDHTPLKYNQALPDVNLAAGQALPASIPDKGIVTIFGKT